VFDRIIVSPSLFPVGRERRLSFAQTRVRVQEALHGGQIAALEHRVRLREASMLQLAQHTREGRARQVRGDLGAQGLVGEIGDHRARASFIARPINSGIWGINPLPVALPCGHCKG
jgi:hypothetical protein